MDQLVQVFGSLLILVAFAATQRGALTANARSYLLLNLVGSTILTFLAAHERMWGFLLLECCWALVSGWGLIAELRHSAPVRPLGSGCGAVLVCGGGSRWVAARVAEPEPRARAVLLLHGGPGMSFEYLDGLGEEVGAGFQIAAYQQRGIEPSTLAGPFAVEREVADALAVLDALSWERAWVVGHSWGGHLLLHIAVAAPERLHGGLAIEPLGATGDGGSEAFEAEMLRRVPDGDRQRAEALDEQAMRGEGSPEESLESLRLVWPAYFASPDHVMALGDTKVSVPAYADLLESLQAALPRLESALADLEVPSASWPGTAARCPTAKPRGRPHEPFPARGSRWSRAPGTSHGSSGLVAFAPRSSASWA